MKLFIIQASENWQYCGGGAAVIAERFEEVWPLLNAAYDGELEPLFESEEAIPKRIWQGREINNINAFVLVETFAVPEQPPRVVMFSFNYA